MPARKRLDKLTPDQEAMLPTIREEWLGIGLSTDRADRDRALAGVRAAYAAAHLPPPAVVVWLDSPLQGVVGAEYLRQLLERMSKDGSDQVWDQVRDQVGGQVGDQVGDQVWDQVRDQVGGQVGDQVWDQVGDQVWGQVRGQVRDQVWDQVRDQVWDQVRDQVGGQVGDQVGGQVWGQVWDQVYRAVYGQHDAGWLGYYDAFSRFGLSDLTHPLDGLSEVAKSAGWWWPFRGAVLLTERPLRIRRDERNRLHCEDGPAIVYPDGWGVWSWHGTRVPQEAIETPAELVTAKRISDEPNAEVRRALVERIGAERYMALAKAKVVGTDDWGKLWAATAPEPMRVVEVLNSTPEPDGSTKTYWLRVPHTKERAIVDHCLGCGTDLATVPQTPHAAIAWSFSCCTSCYQPVNQT
jgi:hypothetical protein